MSRWLLFNNVPYEHVVLMEEHELLANSIVFGQFNNGGLEWDWELMDFIRPPS